jgi:hypothetical protein
MFISKHIYETRGEGIFTQSIGSITVIVYVHMYIYKCIHVYMYEELLMYNYAHTYLHL